MRDAWVHARVGCSTGAWRPGNGQHRLQARPAIGRICSRMRPAPALPQHPGLDSYCELAESLRFLGCDHILSLLQGTERQSFMVIDGVWIRSQGFSWQFADASYLEKVRQAWRLDNDPRRRAAADHVIDIVQQALANDTLALRTLALFQVWKLLRACSPQNTSPESLHVAAVALGIAAEEADLLVDGVLATIDGPDPQIVEAALRARWSKQLRAAGHLADRLEPVAADTRLQAFLAGVRADNHRLDALLGEAVSLENAARTEDAAACYLRAGAMVSDEPAIDAGLQRCPPPAPLSLEADVRGSQVELRWAPAATSVGSLSNRVVRVSAAGSTLVCEVAHGHRPQAVDAGPPLGEEIRYVVRTVREGRVESAPVASPPRRVAPVVEDLAVATDRHGVTGSWRVPEGAVAVRVTRGEERPGQGAGEDIIVSSGLTRFRDPGVLGDCRYEYRVACGYQEPSGQVAWSAERVVAVFAGRWPQPVMEVQAGATAAGDGVSLQWESPGDGSVLVLEVTSPAPEPGTDLAASAVSSLGAVCWQGQATALGLAMGCEVPLPGRGVHYLTMVTVVGERAVTGAVQAAEVLEGVHHPPTCRRLGESIQLCWEWPRGVTQALVRWSGPGNPPDAMPPLRVTLDSYQSRGVLIRACDGGRTITITPLSTVPGWVSVGVPAIAHVEPQYEVSYELCRARRGRGAVRSVDVRLSGVPPVSPTFTLIARPGKIRPTRVDQGELVLQAGVDQIPPAQTTRFAVGPLPVPAPCYLLGFVTGPGSGSFRVAHPDHRQLLVER